MEETGVYTVTAVWAHEDPLTVRLTIDGEPIDTTPEHPFLTADGAWVTAADLAVGAEVRSANGHVGVVDAITLVAAPQLMYNMTVADAHTYAVGDGQWVVHNSCIVPARLVRFTQDTISPHTNHLARDSMYLDDLIGYMSQDGFRGRPLNVVGIDGALYSLDHRRLVAAKHLGLEIPVNIGDISNREIRKEFLRKSSGIRAGTQGLYIDIKGVGIRIDMNGNFSFIE